MVGEKLMKLRRKSGMSQQDVANALSVSRQTISNWESGSSAPDIGKAIELAALYRISLDDLVDDEIDVTVAAGGKGDGGIDTHVLKSLEGSQCRIALTSGLLMASAGFDGVVRVLEADTDWVRVEYERPRKGRAVELVDMGSVAGFQIVAPPSAEEPQEQKGGAFDGCE
ncbi:helix-turn-helix transcriptional regulator [Raoultibacter timonensis]|uniref:helix-turn-helix transcriptional regulator n=1 Tax=Raoultibacter timonensis TaxID=1907662 RepID=UPI0026DB3956|nr:helix-turn-helix transcriptional regulator [Raoultibacter timonensis]